MAFSVDERENKWLHSSGQNCNEHLECHLEP